MKILVIEDSEALRRSLQVGFSNLGFTVDETGDGSEGLSMALSGSYDLLVLDLMLPSVDGMSILQALRSGKSQSRVLILSARSEPQDKINGLMKGADDYLTKPFSFEELHARVLALLRRGSLQSQRPMPCKARACKKAACKECGVPTAKRAACKGTAHNVSSVRKRAAGLKRPRLKGALAAR